MERLLNQYDKEYMKMALLKHEETFREQVYELHRLYRIQKMLMRDISKNTRSDHPHCRSNTTPNNRAESKQSLDSGWAVESDLELTLGTRSYYGKKILKGGEAGTRSDNSGPGISSSSSGSSRGPRGVVKQESLKWGPETPVLSNQDRLNSPPWLFQALSLNMT